MASKVFPAGRIYKIVNNVNDLMYVGSTTQTLSQRMTTHRSHAKNGNIRKVYVYMREIGVSKFEILLLEETKAITREALRALEHKYICELDTVNHGLNSKYENEFCEHQRLRNQCVPCGGSQICEHSRQRANCKQCDGTSICEHNRHISKCKQCGGASICEHGRQRTQCKSCAGSSICEHQKVRSHCVDCGGSVICEHQRQRHQCAQCNPCKYCGSANTGAHRATVKHSINFILY